MAFIHYCCAQPKDTRSKQTKLANKKTLQNTKTKCTLFGVFPQPKLFCQVISLAQIQYEHFQSTGFFLLSLPRIVSLYSMFLYCSPVQIGLIGSISGYSQLETRSLKHPSNLSALSKLFTGNRKAVCFELTGKVMTL